MFETTIKRLGSAALAVGLLFALAAPGQAQQPQPAPDQDVPEIAQDELETFAEAYVEIDQIRADLEAEMATAESAEEANQLQQEANQRMEAILRDHGLTVEEYTQITQVLNVDPEQREEFMEIVEELTEGETGPMLH